MVEAPRAEAGSIEIEMDRRVIRSIKKYTDGPSGSKFFVASAAMFAHNEMDGKVSLLQPEQLLSDQQKQEPTSLITSQTFGSEAACCDSTIVKVGGKSLLISGFDDGVVCILDLDKTNGKSFERVVYKKQNDNTAMPLGEGQYDQWDEQSWEHTDTIMSIEATAAESSDQSQVKLVTASKDGTIFVWSLSTASDQGDDMMTFIADSWIDEPLTKAKWLTDSTILAASVDGKLYALQIKKDDQGVEFLSKPRLVYSTEHEVAIWDLVTLSSGSLEVWVADDSGRVTQLTLADENSLTVSKTTVVHQFVNESALCLSLDILRLPGGGETWTTVLSLGSNSCVVVLERTGADQSFSQMVMKQGVRDNVSCLRTIYFGGDRKQIWTFYATYDGRLLGTLAKQLA